MGLGENVGGWECNRGEGGKPISFWVFWELWRRWILTKGRAYRTVAGWSQASPGGLLASYFGGLHRGLGTGASGLPHPPCWADVQTRYGEEELLPLQPTGLASPGRLEP